LNSALLTVPAWLWAVFAAVVLATLILDLGVFHRNAHAIGMREALAWSAVWIALALLFNLGILLELGPSPALEFLTGYLVEKSLSVDNIFVFAIVLSYFSVPARYQHKVLFWGIFGAMALRLALILIGAALIARFHWILYIFGAFLFYAGARMAFERGVDVHPEQNPVVQLLRRFVPIEPRYHGGRFAVRLDGRLLMTPLLVVLAVVETTDILFALDSIPAIFGITTNPFIVYTSNIFAILGLRALYFVLASMLEKFRYLRFGLAVVLVFVGVKMLISSWIPIPTHMALAAVVGILTGTVLLSIYWPTAQDDSAPPPAVPPKTEQPGAGDVVDPRPRSLSE
jgi:TerC family integral membrane protein